MFLLFWYCLYSLVLNIPKTHAAYITLPITEDTYVEENFSSISPWNNRNLYLGTDLWYSKGRTRILIKPDFQALRNLDILSSDIVSVELSLTSYEYEGSKQQVVIDAYTTTSAWSMSTATWSMQPSISSKKDTTSITTSTGDKSINVTNAFLYAYADSPIERGVLLKINSETEKALIFWAHGCDIAPDEPRCSSIEQRPYFRVQVKDNHTPSQCVLNTIGVKTVTNDPELVLKANASSDSDNDAIIYTGRVCEDPMCGSLIWEGPIDTTRTTTHQVVDGDYYLSCQATDGHQGAEWGSSITITVDTVRPSPPILIEEPLYTAAFNNKIFWFLGDEQLEYQLLSSERSDFRSYNTYSAWVSDNSIGVPHTKEHIFYYKVRARDIAGNESDWSPVTSTVIDATYPTLKYFKTNKTLLSPKLSSSHTIEGNAYIQGGIDDENLRTIQLEVKNSSGKMVGQFKAQEKSYLWTHWPDTPDFLDGTYLLQLTAEDYSGHLILSDPIFITIDTQPPAPPAFSGIKENTTVATKNITIAVSCVYPNLATVYVGGKIVASQQSKHTIKLSKNDGTYTLSATCTDLAGNKSSKKLTFSVDTTPPQVPTITYAFDEGKKVVTIKLYCREDASTEIFLNGSHLGSGTCKKNSYFELPYDIQNNLPFYGTFTGRLADKYGNWSALADKTVYLQEKRSSTTPKEKLTCSAVYLMASHEYRGISCNWPQDGGLQFSKTVQFNTTSYTSELTVLQGGTPVPLSVTVVACKTKSLWDPRTWFTCVEEIREIIKTATSITPLYSSTGIYNQDESTIAVSHAKVEEIKIRYKYYLHFVVSIGDTLAQGSYTTSDREFVFSPAYSGKNYVAYLSWLFQDKVQVSQWHGNTAYQKPHSGIDFSVGNIPIKAPATGNIVEVGYHKKNSCNSGGYYVGIKHANGLYTYYFHLKSTTNLATGKKLAIGNKITKGTGFIKSGNSGMFNCETLAFHLHFEVRKSANSLTHINPVPFIAIDWNTIKTANALRFPQRLSGENPHPKF